MSRVILVSNRLPVTLRRTRNGQVELVRSSGGLVSALDPVHRSGDNLWVGNLGEQPDSERASLLGERRFLPVPVSGAENRGYYLGYSNSSLWPLLHYLPERARFRKSYFEAYRTVNERFADVIASHASDDDRIWVHDYQLMMLPGMLRERLPNARIAFFLHTPFPSSEVFRLLPEREALLRGLLGADVIGFHTYDYARHFVSTLLRVLGLLTREGTVDVDGRPVRIATQPIGIDVQAIRRSAFSPGAEVRLRALYRLLRDRRMILGVDRLDYTKGIPLKLEAFRQLIAHSNHWRDTAVLVQVAVPSRTGVQSYREIKREVEQLVGEINGAHSSPGHVPIHYIYRSISPTELGALYRAADVCLVTPVRDGMNLVAKEYAACQAEGDGVLVLSEFAGAASELGEALRVNPWDVEGTAATLERALEMSPLERYERMAPMARRIETYDVHTWVRRSLRDLEQRTPAQGAPPTHWDPRELARTLSPQLLKAQSPAFFLDYDGTLREFEAHPAQATPTEETFDLLTRLCRIEGALVVIISGRDRDTLSKWFEGFPVLLVAEHGAWFQTAPGSEWQVMDAQADASWKSEVRPILREYTARTPGAEVEEKTAAMVWHYRNAESDLARWQVRELTAHLEEYLANYPVEVITGAEIVEVRQQGITKGAAYERLARELGPFDFELAIGDDTTDEDLFDAMGRRAFTVRVGAGPSKAGSCLATPAEARAFLFRLAAVRAEA